MKILMVTASFPFGNGEAFLAAEIERLIELGNEVLIVPFWPRGQLVHQDAQNLLAFTKSYSFLSPGILKEAVREAFRTPQTAMKGLSDIKPSRNLKIYLKNLSVLPKGLWLAAVARSWGAQHIHAHWMSTTATIALIAGEADGIPVSFTAHRWDIVENNLFELKSKKASFIRFISQSGINMAEAIGIPRRNWQVIHLGVKSPPEGKPRFRERNSEPRQPFNLFCPANLIPVKGHKYLIEAMNLLQGKKDIVLLIAGSGKLKAELCQQVNALGLKERVLFLGQLPHTELIKLYKTGQIDAVILPSVDLGSGEHEGIPVSLMEAMSFGIPTISTTTGGITELLGDGAGLLVPPADPGALASAVLKLIEDPQLYLKLEDAGRRKVNSEFSTSKTVDELMKLFKETQNLNNYQEAWMNNKVSN